MELEDNANASFGRLWNTMNGDFERAIEAQDINETHRIWCRICELWLYFNQGEDAKEPDEQNCCQEKYTKARAAYAAAGTRSSD